MVHIARGASVQLYAIRRGWYCAVRMHWMVLGHVEVGLLMVRLVVGRLEGKVEEVIVRLLVAVV